MSAQGWTPGSFLGASNAAHSSSYTAASSSHIRVVLKDDTLGLGARPRNPLTGDEPTGLDAFQDLLGRLNGKSDVELVNEQRRREEIKVLSYLERRWKSMTFVPGGFLEKDKAIEDLILTKKRQLSESKPEVGMPQTTRERRKDRKKRKAESDDKEGDNTSSSTPLSATLASTDADNGSSVNGQSSKMDKAKSKEERRKKKFKKRKLLECATKESEIQPQEEVTIAISSLESTEKNIEGVQKKSKSIVKVREHRPLGRQVIRGRYIQQKKLAIMDARSLNEVRILGIHRISPVANILRFL